MRCTCVWMALVLSAWLGAAPASAHHAFSVAFDAQRPVSIEGVVTDVKWENPHSWIFVEAKRPDGAVEQWRFETQPPNTLRRTGVTAALLKPGARVTIKGYGAQDRSATVGAASQIVFASWWSGGIGVKDNTLDQLEKLYRPEARAIMDRLTEDDDPTLRCMPYGYPRAMTLPSNQQFQIVHKPGLMVIMNEYFHSFRVVPTDGRPHPDDVVPTYLGDSEGRWDGDTLMVDVVGFNGQIWLADGADKPNPTSTGGWFTSDALHVVERWRLVDRETLEYQATVEDPKVLTGPWTTPAIRVKRAPEVKVREAMCLDTTTYGLTQKGRQERAKP